LREGTLDAPSPHHRAFPWGVPDAPIALALEAAILALCGLARSKPARSVEVDRILMVATAGGGLGAIRYLVEMVRLRRACGYCIAAAGAMLAMVPLAMRNAVRWVRSAMVRRVNLGST
jgi:hypothetical protein